MSIKDLFTKKSISVSVTEKDSTDYSEAESVNYVTEFEKYSARFIPPINYEDPSQFARYGLAQRYYKDSIEYITRTYPYDGSYYEKQKWHNESSDLVNYFFENKYPRNNGFINFGNNYGNQTQAAINGYSDTNNVEYILFNGTYNKGNIYNPSENQEYNIKIDGNVGNTVEFYFKRDNFSGSEKQIVLDIWNGYENTSSNYARLFVELHPGIENEKDKLYFHISSGSSGTGVVELGENLDFTSWHHYAISYINSGSSIKIDLLLDGNVVDTKHTGLSIGRVYGPIKGHIGSLITSVPDSIGTNKGWGKLSGSLDEFRFWKRKRTDKEISINYFSDVAGGTNTDKSNTDLGLYYKFNEGIYDSQNINQYDQTVLDYSGRTSNGNWKGYTLGSRQKGSGIVLSGNSKFEFEDPVVYLTHKDVQELLETYESIGYEYDQQNSTNLYRTLPDWKIDEDQENGKSTEVLFQIISNTFDTIHNSIKFLPSIKELSYRQENPLSFNINLLQNYGFEAVDILTDAEVIELFLFKNESELYKEKIYKIKNFIYQNLYNNLLYINKSKGTNRSFRNIIKAFGINEDIIKLRLYPNNVETELKERLSIRQSKKYGINFNKKSNHGATLYQVNDSGSTNSLAYIPDTTEIKSLGSTFEVELMFPKKVSLEEEERPEFFVTSSLFGMHETDGLGSFSSIDRADLQVFAIKSNVNQKDVFFKLSSSYFEIDLDSKICKNVYDNNKWNFALRIKPENYPLGQSVSGSEIQKYSLNLYGVSYEQDIEEDSFLVSSSVEASKMDNFFSAKKGIYVGAHRENYTGSIMYSGDQYTSRQKTDIEVFSVRYWNSYLENKDLELHSKDPTNYGANSKDYKTAAQQLHLVDNVDVSNNLEQNNTLMLHWNFLKLENSSEFTIKDFSSSSLSADDGVVKSYSNYNFSGKGTFFDEAGNNTIRYINGMNQQSDLESISSDDLINIVDEYDDLYERETRPVEHYFLLEKSMYSVISKEMISWIGTINQFNELIGQPINRYKQEYEHLRILRNLFFDKIENEPNYNKFKEFYRWVDDSISAMIAQLIPASVELNSYVTNVIESHVLERNKYNHKLPTIEFAGDPPIGKIRAINELLYDWKFGHAPLNGLENTHCLWWRIRAEKSGILSEERNKIFQVIKSGIDRKYNNCYQLNVENETLKNARKKSIYGSILTKNANLDIIKNETMYKTEPLVFNDLIPSFIDCEDEEP